MKICTWVSVKGESGLQLQSEDDFEKAQLALLSRGVFDRFEFLAPHTEDSNDSSLTFINRNPHPLPVEQKKFLG